MADDVPQGPGREHSIANPDVRKAVLDLVEAAHPGTDESMRAVRAMLMNRATLEDPHMGIVYTGVAIGILLRVATEVPEAAVILNKYAERVRNYEETGR